MPETVVWGIAKVSAICSAVKRRRLSAAIASMRSSGMPLWTDAPARAKAVVAPGRLLLFRGGDEGGSRLGPFPGRAGWRRCLSRGEERLRQVDRWRMTLKRV